MSIFKIQTLKTLIPKGDHQQNFGDYRPISLANVTYKTLAKVLVNRMQPILSSPVHPFQNFFIKEEKNSLILFCWQQKLFTLYRDAKARRLLGEA